MSDCSRCSFAEASTKPIVRASTAADRAARERQLDKEDTIRRFTREHARSLKLAKRQGSSLNPSKISGQCGRLLCCLAHENDQYDKGALKQAPQPAA